MRRQPSRIEIAVPTTSDTSIAIVAICSDSTSGSHASLGAPRTTSHTTPAASTMPASASHRRTPLRFAWPIATGSLRRTGTFGQAHDEDGSQVAALLDVDRPAVRLDRELAE